MKISSVILAGGSGSRMGAEVPKQFIVVDGLPILMRTIVAIQHCVSNYVNNFIVVLPQSQFDYWSQLCREFNFGVAHSVVAGGKNRFESVRSGLTLVQDADLVLVHDGVRPLVRTDMVERTLQAAIAAGAAIPVVEVVDSLRMIVDNSSHIVNRAIYRAVQTPQIFRTETLIKAYEQPYDPLFTDDASVVERSGQAVTLVQGSVDNIKITTTTDLLLAHAIIEQYQRNANNEELRCPEKLFRE